MITIGSLLSNLLKNLGIDDKIKLGLLQKEWHSLFGEPLSLHTYPADLKGGELVINVDSPLWLQELKFFSRDMLKKLHPYHISSIKFRHGRVYKKGIQNPAGKKKTATKPLSPSDAAWINEITSDIEEPEIREAVKRAIEKNLTGPQPTAFSD